METRAVSVKRRVLPNGLRVIAAEVRAVPAFAALLCVEAGSRYESDRRAGVAELTAGLLVERPGDAGRDLDRRVDSLGLSLDAAAGYETGALVAAGLASRCPDALSLLFELVASPRFDRSTVQDAVDRQLTEIAEEEDDPYCVCRRELLEDVFAGHPRHRPVVGYDGTVRGLGTEDVSGFHESRYRPGHAVLCVVGDIASERVLDLASGVFEAWSESGAEELRLRPPTPLNEPRSRFIRMDRAQTHVALGSVSIRRSDPSYYAVLVMDAILGDGAGFGSRLASRLREESGLAYVVESDAAVTPGLDPGLFWVYTATSPDRLRRVLDGVQSELRRILREPPSADELACAKAFVLGRHVLAVETNEARAARLVRLARYGLGPDHDDRFEALVSAISADDVLEAANRVIDLDHSATIVVGPRSGTASP